MTTQVQQTHELKSVGTVFEVELTGQHAGLIFDCIVQPWDVQTTKAVAIVQILLNAGTTFIKVRACATYDKSGSGAHTGNSSTCTVHRATDLMSCNHHGMGHTNSSMQNWTAS